MSKRDASPYSPYYPSALGPFVAHPDAVHPTALKQGATPTRPHRGKSQAHPGVAPLSAFAHRTQKFQPLPTPLGEPPYRIALDSLTGGLGRNLKKIVFHTAGDTGGV